MEFFAESLISCERGAFLAPGGSIIRDRMGRSEARRTTEISSDGDDLLADSLQENIQFPMAPDKSMHVWLSGRAWLAGVYSMGFDARG